MHRRQKNMAWWTVFHYKTLPELSLKHCLPKDRGVCRKMKMLYQRMSKGKRWVNLDGEGQNPEQVVSICTRAIWWCWKRNSNLRSGGKLCEGPPITKVEVRVALKKIKNGKAVGPDGVAREMTEALEDYGIEKVCNIFNAVYDSSFIPKDRYRLIFITLAKNARAIDCKLCGTRSLMSHIMKVLRIIMMRIRKQLKQEIGVGAVWLCGR